MIIYQKMIHRDDCRRNPSVLYLFGDNERRTGMGGQAAEMRGEPNVVGIRTKRAPGRDDQDFWNDKQFEKNCALMEEDLSRVKSHLRRGGTIVIPSDGIGTNRAEMEKRCPKTFHVLVQVLSSLDNIPVTI